MILITQQRDWHLSPRLLFILALISLLNKYSIDPSNSFTRAKKPSVIPEAFYDASRYPPGSEEIKVKLHNELKLRTKCCDGHGYDHYLPSLYLSPSAMVWEFILAPQAKRAGEMWLVETAGLGTRRTLDCQKLWKLTSFGVCQTLRVQMQSPLNFSVSSVRQQHTGILENKVLD